MITVGDTSRKVGSRSIGSALSIRLHCPPEKMGLDFAKPLAHKRHVPEPQASRDQSMVPSERLRIRDLAWLGSFSLRGFSELVRARIVFERLHTRSIIERNERAFATAAAAGAPAAMLKRISYVLPRLSRRLPWRSDCLIQAIAAQNWLLARGFASEIQIGVERPEGATFAAHAWLMHDGHIVTGGDIAKYKVILGKSSPGERDHGAQTR